MEIDYWFSFWEFIALHILLFWLDIVILSFCCFSGARKPWNQGLSGVPQSADDPPQCKWPPSTNAWWSGATKARSSSSGCQGTKGRNSIWTHENCFINEDFARIQSSYFSYYLIIVISFISFLLITGIFSFATDWPLRSMNANFSGEHWRHQACRPQ